jgi:hypothetical protein
MEQRLDELSLPELFVLAACGKLAPLQYADDLGGLPTSGRLHDGSEALHGPVKDATAFHQVEDALIKQGLKQSRGDNSAGQTSSGGSIGFVSHSDPP